MQLPVNKGPSLHSFLDYDPYQLETPKAEKVHWKDAFRKHREPRIQKELTLPKEEINNKLTRVFPKYDNPNEINSRLLDSKKKGKSQIDLKTLNKDQQKIFSSKN